MVRPGRSPVPHSYRSTSGGPVASRAWRGHRPVDTAPLASVDGPAVGEAARVAAEQPEQLGHGAPPASVRKRGRGGPLAQCGGDRVTVEDGIVQGVLCPR